MRLVPSPKRISMIDSSGQWIFASLIHPCCSKKSGHWAAEPVSCVPIVGRLVCPSVGAAWPSEVVSVDININLKKGDVADEGPTAPSHCKGFCDKLQGAFLRVVGGLWLVVGGERM